MCEKQMDDLWLMEGDVASWMDGDLGVDADLREIKKHVEYGEKREEILEMIWNMEEEIMGRTEAPV